MGDHDNGFALINQFKKDFKDQLGSLRIQPSGRLISDNYGWIISQGTGDGNSLLLPARNFGG